MLHPQTFVGWDGLQGELPIGIATSYCTFDGQRMVMRTGVNVYWLHGDHLGSASLVTSITGIVVSDLRYKPFGDVRWFNGAAPTLTIATHPTRVS